MRLLLTITIACCAFLSCQAVFADAPDISYNVHVRANATPAQCPSSLRGDAQPASGIDISRFGSDLVEGPGVMDCTGCAIDNQSSDCVCKRCYSFYSGD